MSSTNSTTNYELSQFIGSDKPAWLADYNSDMAKIDAQMKLNADSATTANAGATTANTNIGTLANLTTTDKTSLVGAINEVKSDAGTAQGTANTAVTKANENATAIGIISDILNINTTIQYTSANATCSNGVLGGGELYVSRNNDGSLFKVYGNMIVTSSTTGEVTVTLPNTGVASESAYNIVGGGYSFVGSTQRPITIVVGTDGNLRVKFTVSSAGEQNLLRPVACLYFNSDFGNIQPQEA